MKSLQRRKSQVFDKGSVGARDPQEMEKLKKELEERMRPTPPAQSTPAVEEPKTPTGPAPTITEAPPTPTPPEKKEAEREAQIEAEKEAEKKEAEKKEADTTPKGGRKVDDVRPFIPFCS